jgi:lysozyme family protein
MARFEDAIPTILAHEGGIVDHPADPGGLTNRGITWATWQRVKGPDATRAGLLALTEDEATAIYRAEYWLPIYELLDSQNVATKVFDVAVNAGHRQAHRLLQESVSALGYRVAKDGLLGPNTLAAANSCDPAELVAEICEAQAAFYRGITNINPGMAAFLPGWLERAKWPFLDASPTTEKTA